MGLLDSLFSSNSSANGGLLDFLRPKDAPASFDSRFDASAPPSSFADRFNAAPNAPQPFTPSGRQFDPASFDPNSFAPNQAQPIAVGNNYQMPRIGAAPLFAPDPSATPPNAQPTQGQGQGTPQAPGPAQPPQPLPPAFGGGGYMDRIANGGSLIGSMFGDSGKQQNARAQYDALRSTLIQNGSTPQEAASKAMLALMNPKAAETIFSENLTNKEKYGVVSENPIEGKKYGFINERDQTVNGKPLGEGGGATTGVGLLAPGVTQADSNLSGEDYMKQFSPEVQAAAKAYINGDVMPTGNARMQSIANFAKTIAQKYGADTGIPVSDALYAGKRKMQTDLASSSNSTMGGILSNGESSFKHLAEYTGSVANQGNASHNFPGGGLLAHGQNYIGNTLGGSDTQAKVKAINDNLGKYGAESTKFYAGTGGGVEERMNALREMNATTTSGEEAAAYAEKEKSLMLDRLNTKFQEIRNTLGEERGNAEIAKHMPDIKKNIATIDANIAKLRGAAPAANAKPATVTQNGHTYNLQADGSYK